MMLLLPMRCLCHMQLLRNLHQLRCLLQLQFRLLFQLQSPLQFRLPSLRLPQRRCLSLLLPHQPLLRSQPRLRLQLLCLPLPLFLRLPLLLLWCRRLPLFLLSRLLQLLLLRQFLLLVLFLSRTLAWPRKLLHSRRSWPSLCRRVLTWRRR